ncbi:MAG: TonB-dependent receptor plug domain-containing protein [Flavobacteriales bacterium]|nr:TonB-dependent receptor plug domain-containing protein [Flavobacteriales bacterium]
MKHVLFALLLISSLSTFAQTGIVQGRVSDANSNEPIPFANVVLQGTTLGASTDLDGNYEIKNITPGLYNVEVSFLGYKTHVEYEVEVFNNKPALINVKLEEDSKTLEAVVVTANPFEKKEESPVSLRTIGVNEIQRNPGGNRDISKALQSLPGVQSTVAFRNDIIIRGGAPNENRFYLDGVEVPNINHFATQGSSGGPVGMINVNFIREVEFYSGAFPANRGNALSSVLNFKMKDPRQDRIGGNFTLGANDAGITIEGPIAKGHSFMFSYRRSYLQFLFALLKLPFLPTYDDFQLKYKAKINDKNELIVVGLGAIDQFKLNLDKNLDEDQKRLVEVLPVNNQWNYTLGVNWKNYREKGYSQLVVSRNMLNNTAIKYMDNIEVDTNLILNYKSQEIENKMRFENNWRDKGWKINYGVVYEYARYTNSTFNKITLPDGSIFSKSFSSAIELHKWGAFGQVSRSFVEGRLLLSLGARVDGNSYSKEMAKTYETFSPRFSLSYSFNDNFSLNFNVGRYFQQPPYTTFGYRDNSGVLVNKQNGLKYIASNHAVLGTEYVNKNGLKVSVEGFFKYWQHYPFLLRDSISLANLGANFGVIGNEAVVSNNQGRAYGVEFLVQQKLWKGFYGILAYTWVRSEFQDRNGKFVPSAWDAQHLISITAGKKFKRNWELGVRWRFTGGAPYTPADVQTSSLIPVWQLNRSALPDYSRLNSQRLTPAHFLDMRVDKKWFFKKWALNVYIDVQNVYNFKAQQPPQYIVPTDSNGNPLIDPNDPSRYQLQQVKNVTGTVIPSFGIVVEI